MSAAPPATEGRAAAGAGPTSSAHREAATFVRLGAGIILLAHGVEVSYTGGPCWPALAVRVVWVAMLLAVAPTFSATRRAVVLTGMSVGVLGSAVLDVALLWVTGRSGSPLLLFTPVLATVLPVVAVDAIGLGLLGSAALVAGTGLVLWVDQAAWGAYVVLANAGGGALVSGWLLARAFERSRRAEQARKEELAAAMANLKTLNGLLPVCAWCRRVRTDAGYWQQIESYVSEHTDATFTHGLCEDCFRKNHPEDAL